MLSMNDARITELADVLGDPVPAGGDEVRFESPFGQGDDPNKHLYVNVVKGKWMDFKSGQAGSLTYLHFLLGVVEGERIAKPLDTLGNLKDLLAGLGNIEPFVREIAPLPEWFKDIDAGSIVHRYLRDRGVDDADISFYGLGEGSGEFRDWVVMPSITTGGRCEYWVSRDIAKKTYRNPTVDRRYHVCFLDKALEQNTGQIVVCEGIFSAIAAGRDAVATLGKLVTQNQLNVMWDAGVRDVTLALDGDAWKESLDTAERMIKIGMQVKVLPLPEDQDPADLGRPLFRSLLESCSQPVTTLSLMKMRLVTTA